MSGSGVLFKGVSDKVLARQYSNEATFRQEFVEALKNELATQCPDKAALLNPVLEYKVGVRKRADTRLFNVFFEFEIPPPNSAPVTKAKELQLIGYLDKVGKSANVHGNPIFGFVTNGWFAEIFRYPAAAPFQSGDFPKVTSSLVALISQSATLGITEPDDFIAIFGTW
jgi:hypothetical protein